MGGGFSSSTNYVQESTVGEIATGPSESPSYKLRAGYQQMQEVYIAITGGADVTMTPSIGGLTGGTSNGSTSVRVVTDSPSGYQLSITSVNGPAMQKGADTISDYVPVAEADYSFTVGGGEAFFGFSPEGPDIVQAYLDDTVSACNEPGGTDSSLTCWDGLSTSATTIAEATGANHPTGATTTIQFRVGVGSGANLPAGEYYATTTLTAITL